MDINFLTAYRNTVSNEGCLSNNKNDSGKLTWKGISIVMHPEWDGWPLVKSYIARGLVSEIAKDPTIEVKVQVFYYNEFWLKLQCDKIKNPQIASKLFDTAVNFGNEPAIEFAQRAARINVTGIMDSETINALNQI